MPIDIPNTNGDIAVITDNKTIYEWHLTHKSESNYTFTSNSINYAVKNKDIVLITQLIDFGVKPILNDNIFECTNIELINSLFPHISHDSYLTKGYLHKIINNKIIFEWYYDNGYLNDEFMHEMLKYVKISYDNLVYASNKGYKWCIRYCGEIMLDTYIDIIKMLFKNGNNTNYTIDESLNKYNYKSLIKSNNSKVANNLYWSIYKSDNHDLYRLVVSIDPIIVELLVQHILIDNISIDDSITKNMSHQNYINVMEYIISNKVYNHSDNTPYFTLNKLNRHHYINIIINCVNPNNPDKTLIDIINNEKKECITDIYNIYRLEMLLK